MNSLTAGDILDGLDESADPCEDFVRFACGGWLREHPIPSLEYRWGLFDTLEERTVYDIKGKDFYLSPRSNKNSSIHRKRRSWEAKLL